MPWGDWDARPLQAFLGEPLNAMVQNLGQADNGAVGVGATSGTQSQKVLSQGFTTGSDGFGYRLQGVGVNIEGSDGRVPDDSAAVSVAVHADSGGQPGEKLFDLVSPTEYASGHSFFEAPAGAYLEPTTSYVLVWTHNYGAVHQLQRTSSNGKDSGARTGASIADAYRLGSDLDSLNVDPAGNALELAVYTEVLTEAPIKPGEILIRLPTQALVSNIGQTSLMSGSQVTTNQRLAQAFRSGSEAATLDSVEVDVHTAPGTTSDVLVAIYTHQSGQPGTKLYDLTNPSAIGTGAQKFTAPVGARLAADKNYFVVASTTSSTFRLRSTASGDEDAGGAEGWSIGNQRLFSTSTGWGSSHGPNQIRVNGHFSRRVTPTEVDPGWALVPDDIADEGGVFRLLFLTSTKTAATDTDIETYNSFVQTRAAAGHPAIQSYSEGFRAVASTAAIAARDNTYTIGTDVPVYWLGGNKIARNYGDFYDGTWDDEENPTDESGAANSLRAAWTGSADDGTKGVHDTHGATVLGGGARAQAAFGTLDSATRGPLSGGHGWREIERGLYAVSEVFTVGPNPARITDLAITSEPGPDRNYTTGDEIEVTATFGAPVSVGGRPRVKLRLGQGGESDRWAEYERGGAVFVGEVPERVLVSKWEGPPFAALDLDSTTDRHAQAFTTGAESNGYRLDSIGIFIFNLGDDSTAGEHLTVTLNQDDNGDPGDVLCTLSDPISFFTTVPNQFGAAGCPTLAANTTYFVVIERVVITSDRIVVATHTRVGVIGVLDDGGLPDWSIAESRHSYVSNAWSETSDQSIGIQVRGAVALPPTTTLVANTGQNLTVSHGLDDGESSRAQSFTTGNDAHGYALSSIGFDFSVLTNSSSAGDHLTATLNSDASGSPGGVLCTLSDPANFIRGLNTFDAPPDCPTLSPNTTYFAVIERVIYVASDGMTLAATSSGNEDAGSAAGWSIGNGGHVFSVQNGRWLSTSQAANQIEINGAAVPANYSPDQVVFTYTVQAEDESGPDGVSVGVEGTENAIDLNGGAIALAGSELDAVLDFTPLPGDGEHLVNVAGPELVDAVTSRDGSQLKLTFDQDLNPDSPPRASHFTVMVDGEPVTLSEEVGSLDELPAGSPLIPAGLGAGDRFRVLFLTSTTRDATSSDIADYNSFVQTAAAGGLAALQPYSEGFRAVASTADVDARDNARTTYTDDDKGVPVYWLGGNRLADDYEDFHDGDWDEEQNVTDESGEAHTGEGLFLPWPVWTGSDDDGTEHIRTATGTPHGLGTSAIGGAGIGTLKHSLHSPDHPNPLFAGNRQDTDDTYPLYALSQVFVVPGGSVGTDPDYLAPVSGRSVLLGLTEPLTSPDQQVTVSYRDPSTADDTGVVEDVLGNDAPSFGVGDELPRPVVNRLGLRLELFPDSPLVPGGVGIGDRFRLLFMTSTTRDATSSEIEDYNLFVQAAAAAGRADIREFSDDFYAVASTRDVDARDNTGTTYTEADQGVPIYWLGGNLIAEDYADFYDGEWDDEVNRTDESGGATTSKTAWTGSTDDGTKLTENSTWLGGDAPRVASLGVLDDTTAGNNPLSGGARLKSETHPLYGLSEVFTVVSPAAIQEVKIVSDPGNDGNYETGDDIEVAVTFGEAVDVSGTPRVKLRLGETADSERWAEYDADILVKNTGQPRFSGSTLDAASPKFAQGFTTGGGDYALTSVGIRFHTIDNPARAGGMLTVTLHASEGGQPGAELCTLVNPEVFTSNALNTFDAGDACPDLEPGTDYFVVIERTNVASRGRIALWRTASFAEDGGSQAGWSVGDRGQVYGSTGQSSPGWRESGAPFLVKVKGELSAIYRNGVLISNTGQTLQAGFDPREDQTRITQRFITGASSLGYRLSSIGLPMGAITDTATVGGNLRVTLNAARERIPGDTVLCTLSHPASFSENAVNRFGASTCPALAPNTHYFVVAERLIFDPSFTMEVITSTSSSSYDSRAAGWQLEFNTWIFGPFADGWEQTSEGVYRIEVSGRALLPSEQPEQPEPPAPLIKQVANTGQTGSVGSALTSTQSKRAQAFTTGTSAGSYELSNVGVRFGAIAGSGVRSDFTVSLHAGGADDPGELLCEFIEPSGIVTTNQLVPWQQWGLCPHLEPNTTYFVVVDRHTFTASKSVELSVTASDAEDAGGRPGWSIANDSRVYDGSAWASGGGLVHGHRRPRRGPAGRAGAGRGAGAHRAPLGAGHEQRSGQRQPRRANDRQCQNRPGVHHRPQRARLPPRFDRV